jgi:drug/metabolite transporter (DMT)-like permease
MIISTRYKGIIIILFSNLILSADTPFTAKLISLGRAHLIHGHNPISFCNLLFAGNLIALITLFFIHYQELKAFKVSELTGREWVWILLSAFFLGFVSPTFYFLGIANTNVINVVLISLLQIPLALFAGWLFFNEKISLGMLLSSLLTVFGIVVIFLIPYWLSHDSTMVIHSHHVHKLVNKISFIGDLYVLLEVISTTVGTLICLHISNRLPAGVFSIFSLGLGIVFFFSIVLCLYGWSHFYDLTSPFLWKWMLFYGTIIVALGTYLEFRGKKYATVADLTISSSLVPLAAIFFSFLILGVIPGFSQIIGGSLILVGIIGNFQYSCRVKQNRFALLNT